MCISDWFSKWFAKKDQTEIIHVTHNQTKYNLSFKNPLYDGPNRASEYGNYYENSQQKIKHNEVWKEVEEYDGEDIFDILPDEPYDPYTGHSGGFKYTSLSMYNK